MIPTAVITAIVVFLAYLMEPKIANRGRLTKIAKWAIRITAIGYALVVAYFPLSVIFFPPEKIDPAGYGMGVLLGPLVVSIFAGVVAMIVISLIRGELYFMQQLVDEG